MALMGLVNRHRFVVAGSADVRRLGAGRWFTPTQESSLLNSKRSLARVAAVLATAVAMVTGSAVAASAAPAVFTTPSSGTIQWFLKTPLTIKVGSATVASCVAGFNGPDPSAFSNVGSPLQGTIAGWQKTFPMNCGTMVVINPPAVPFNAEKNGASYSLTSVHSLRIYGTSWSPTGPDVAYSVPWTNGTGGGLLGSPTLTFNDTVVAYSNTFQPIKLTGTVLAVGAGQLS
jgi:hypothetical protein